MRLHDVGIGGTVVKWVDALFDAILVDMLQHFNAVLFCNPIAKFNHFTKFPGRIDVQKRERRLFGVECLDG